MKRQVYTLNNRGKGSLNDLVPNDLYRKVNETAEVVEGNPALVINYVTNEGQLLECLFQTTYYRIESGGLAYFPPILDTVGRVIIISNRTEADYQLASAVGDGAVMWLPLSGVGSTNSVLLTSKGAAYFINDGNNWIPLGGNLNLPGGGE